MQRRGNWRLLGILACLAVALGLAGAASADQQVFEAGLDSPGQSYEINPDAQGRLWVTDYQTGHVWDIDPATGSYKIYDVLGAPSDARQVAGWLWWADAASNILGRVSTTDGAFTHWVIPGAGAFYGTAVDSQGRLWATSADSTLLYRLDPVQAELCTFALPEDGTASYILSVGGYLWLGDATNVRLLRLKVSDNTLKWWELPLDSAPFGMTLDAQGNLWYADSFNEVLARLDPVSGRLASYGLPTDASPIMVAVDGTQVWYTAQGLDGVGSIGRLNPQAASPVQFTPSTHEAPLPPDCSGISPSSSGHVTITTGNLAWSSLAYASAPGTAGVEAVQLPTGGSPWGITVHGGQVWTVDQGRQKLLRMPALLQSGRKLYLPLVLR